MVLSSGSKLGFFHVRNEANAKMAELEAEGNTEMGDLSLKAIVWKELVYAMKEMDAKRSMNVLN